MVKYLWEFEEVADKNILFAIIYKPTKAWCGEELSAFLSICKYKIAESIKIQLFSFL